MNSYLLARILLVGLIYVAVSSTTTCELKTNMNGAASGPVIDGTTKPSASVLQITESFRTFNYALIIRPKLTWLGSLQYCIARGGYPVDITTKEEHEFVLKLAKKSNFLDTTKLAFWSGANSIDMKKREFRWIGTNKTVSKEFFANPTENQALSKPNCLSFNPFRNEKIKLVLLECWTAQPVICKSPLQ